MKKNLILILLLGLYFYPNLSLAQIGTKKTDLLNKTLIQVLSDFKIPSDYESRYKNIIIPLCKQGIIIFDGKLNPISIEDNEKCLKPALNQCYWYIGNSKQNARFVRNIVKNRLLFKGGKLIPGAAKKWVVVK